MVNEWRKKDVIITIKHRHNKSNGTVIAEVTSFSKKKKVGSWMIHRFTEKGNKAIVFICTTLTGTWRITYFWRALFIPTSAPNRIAAALSTDCYAYAVREMVIFECSCFLDKVWFHIAESHWNTNWFWRDTDTRTNEIVLEKKRDEWFNYIIEEKFNCSDYNHGNNVVCVECIISEDEEEKTTLATTALPHSEIYNIITYTVYAILHIDVKTRKRISHHALERKREVSVDIV